jgi:hypothetical protein
MHALPDFKRRRLLKATVAILVAPWTAKDALAFWPLLFRVVTVAGRGGRALVRSGPRPAMGVRGGAAGSTSGRRLIDALDLALIGHDLTSFASAAEAHPVRRDAPLPVEITGHNDSDAPIGGGLVQMVVCNPAYLQDQPGGYAKPHRFPGQFSLPPGGRWRRSHQVALADTPPGPYLIVPTIFNPVTGRTSSTLRFAPDHYAINLV